MSEEKPKQTYVMYTQDIQGNIYKDEYEVNYDGYTAEFGCSMPVNWITTEAPKEDDKAEVFPNNPNEEI